MPVPLCPSDLRTTSCELSFITSSFPSREQHVLKRALQKGGKKICKYILWKSSFPVEHRANPKLSLSACAARRDPQVHPRPQMNLRAICLKRPDQTLWLINRSSRGVWTRRDRQAGPGGQGQMPDKGRAPPERALRGRRQLSPAALPSAHSGLPPLKGFRSRGCSPAAKQPPARAQGFPRPPHTGFSRSPGEQAGQAGKILFIFHFSPQSFKRVPIPIFYFIFFS